MTGLLLLASIVVALPQANVQQKTTGWCSPPVANVQGNVTVICKGVDPQALERLNAQLGQQKQELGEKIREANEWAEKYFELEKRLSEATDDAQLSADAENYLHAGDLDKAAAILDSLLQNEEQQIDRAAANHYDMALISDLQFQPSVALRHLEKAYSYRPDNIHYAHEYARALEGANRLDEAEKVYRLNLVRIRDLPKENQEALPLAAKTLNNLGYVYLLTGRVKEAKASYEEATALYAQLASIDPSTYLLLQASASDGLASVYDKTGELEQAERCYSESLRTYQRVAAEFGAIYNVDAAMLLDHLGDHYAKTRNPDGAETMYSEVASIARRMAEGNQQSYGWVLGLALGHLGDLHHRLGRTAEAESDYAESLRIFRQLPNSVPVYQLLQAAALNNLGALYADTNRFAEAANSYGEALSIFLQLSSDDPTALPHVAVEDHNLGIAYLNAGKFSDAEAADRESIRIYRQLAAKDEITYLDSVAGTLSDLGDAYRKDGKIPLAESSYEEALAAYRRLQSLGSENGPRDVANFLNNLGTFYRDMDRFPEAEDRYKQAISIFRNLSSSGNGQYLAGEAGTLLNLAALGIDHHMPSKEAKASIEEALKIARGLWSANPKLYGDLLAASLATKAQLMGVPPSHGRDGCAFIEEAQRVATSDALKKGVQNLADRCKQVTFQWH